MDLLALSDDDVHALASPRSIISAVERAALSAYQLGFEAPDRTHMKQNAAVFLTMPASSSDMFGVKLISVVPRPGPGEPERPAIQGLMTLHDTSSGAPLAVMNASALTAHRTGAISALAISRISPPDAAKLCIIGCGFQAVWQATYACAVRPIDHISCAGGSPAQRVRFSEGMARHKADVEVTFFDEPLPAIDGADIVIAATSSRTPVLPDDPALLRGRHYVGIGSFEPEAQELPDAIYRLAKTIVIDSEAARWKSGDILNSVARGVVREQDVFTLGALIAGDRTVGDRETTAFKSVGMALYDLYAARELFQQATRSDVGRNLIL